MMHVALNQTSFALQFSYALVAGSREAYSFHQVNDSTLEPRGTIRPVSVEHSSGSLLQQCLGPSG